MNNNHNVRSERALSNLIHLAGAYIAMEAGRTTLITPTRVDISPDRKNAIIFVSVFPDSESNNAINFLARHRDTFRQYLKQHGRFAILPFIKWELDYGEKNRQRLDELSKEIGPIPADEDIKEDV
jgi:ribosome-binding factor A